LESSLKIISKELNKNSSKSLHTDNAIGEILKQLHGMDVYKKAFHKIANDPNLQLDPVTRTWLHEIVHDEFPENKSHTIEWPKVMEPTDKSIEKLRSWDFDVFSLKREELFVLTEAMFQDFNLLEIFQVPREKFRSFISEISQNYFDNPYHNFHHAFDVTQSIYSMLTKYEASSKLTSLEIFAILLAGLLHDVGHPANNNTFHMNTLSNLALRYNDKSVLENFHCSFGYSLLLEHEILKNLSKPDLVEFRPMIIAFILSTDLSLHVEILSKWKNISSYDKEQKVHRVLLGQMLIKAADIGNPTKKFDVAKEWAQHIQKEFFIQGKKEKELHLPISPFMDEENPNLPAMQLGFISFLVKPLFTLLASTLPTQPICEQLESNILEWQRRSNVEKKSEATK